MMTKLLLPIARARSEVNLGAIGAVSVAAISLRHGRRHGRGRVGAGADL